MIVAPGVPAWCEWVALSRVPWAQVPSHCGGSCLSPWGLSALPGLLQTPCAAELTGQKWGAGWCTEEDSPVDILRGLTPLSS